MGRTRRRPGAPRRVGVLALMACGVLLITAAVVLRVTAVPRFDATALGPADGTPVATSPAAPGVLAPPSPAAPVAVSPAPAALSGAVPAGVVPVRLEFPARGVAAPVVPVGTQPDGALAVPAAPQTVGWWAPGALAGSGTGSVVVAGHVDSRTQGLGVLAVLPALTAGEQVVLRAADGASVAYEVAARQEYAKSALPADLFARTGPPRLVLITCGGAFDRATRSYDSNVVVVARPVP